MQKRLVRLFVHTAAVVLLVTALAKFLSAMGDVLILNGPDPIFGIDIRTVLFGTALIESAVAWVCLKEIRISLQVGLVLWLSLAFTLYRVGLWVVGYDKPCSCLGTLTDLLGISPEASDLGMKIVLAYLLIGSGAALFWLRGKSVESNEKVPESANALGQDVTNVADHLA